jgi:hypothetical protein
MIGALRERQFRRYFVGQTTSYLGDGLLPVAVSFAVLDLTGSASDLGLVLAARMVPVVVFLLVGGVWADRLPRHLVMLASDVVRGAVQALLAVLLLTGTAELWHLLLLQALYGVGEAFMRPASTGLLPSIVSAERLQQANALLAASVNSAYILPASSSPLPAPGPRSPWTRPRSPSARRRSRSCASRPRWSAPSGCRSSTTCVPAGTSSPRAPGCGQRSPSRRSSCSPSSRR